MEGVSANSGKHRVVIIGSGFGGLFAAKALSGKDVEVTLISRTGHHLFQPLLYQVATGILSEGDIAPATRDILARDKNVRTILGDVTEIDVEGRTVTSHSLNQATVTPYDSLIVAAGAGQSYFGNDHFAEFAPGMKSIDDALELRGRIFGAFETAELAAAAGQWDDVRSLLTFVVVGAGPTGVEMAGQISELANRTLAEAAAAHLPEGTTATWFNRGADLPHYSEDLDVAGSVPQVATELREAVAQLDRHLAGAAVHERRPLPCRVEHLAQTVTDLRPVDRAQRAVARGGRQPPLEHGGQSRLVDLHDDLGGGHEALDVGDVRTQALRERPDEVAPRTVVGDGALAPAWAWRDPAGRASMHGVATAAVIGPWPNTSGSHWPLPSALKRAT